MQRQAFKRKHAQRTQRKRPVLYGRGKGHYVSIYVPSTINDKPVPRKTFNRRTRKVERFLSNEFGGETDFPAIGGWIDPRNHLIRERVNVVQSHMGLAALHKHAKDVRRFVQKQKKAWGQQAVSVESDGKLYFK